MSKKHNMTNFYDASKIISMRKSEFLSRFWYHYSKIIAQRNRQKIYTKMVMTISNLDNQLFLSSEEKKTKIIRPNQKISDLYLDSDMISRKLISALQKINL